MPADDPTPTPTSDALKPCPFCGGEAYMETGHYYKPYARIACNGDCMAEMTESGQTDAEATASAVTAWNRRAANTATFHEVAEQIGRETVAGMNAALRAAEPQQQGGEDHALCPFCATYPHVDNDHDGPGCTFECCTEDCPVKPSIYRDNEPDVFGYDLARLDWNEMAERPLLWAAHRLLDESGPYSQRDDTPCCRSEDMVALRAAVDFTEGEKAGAEAAFDRRIAGALATPAPAAPAVTDAMVDAACSAYCREIVEQARADFAPGKMPQLYYRPAAIRAALAAALAAAGKGKA